MFKVMIFLSSFVASYCLVGAIINFLNQDYAWMALSLVCVVVNACCVVANYRNDKAAGDV